MFLEAFWVPLGAHWGGSWRPLGAILGPMAQKMEGGFKQGPPHRRRNARLLGSSWGVTGRILGARGAHSGVSWAPYLGFLGLCLGHPVACGKSAGATSAIAQKNAWTDPVSQRGGPPRASGGGARRATARGP